MEKQTIIYLGGFELPDKNAAAHRVLSNAKILKELGYKVVFIGINKDGENLLDKKKYYDSFETWSINYPSNSSQWLEYLYSIKKSLKIIKSYKNVSAIVCYNYPAIPLLKLQRFCKSKNINIIADCTEWYSVQGSKLHFKIIKGLDSFLRMRIIHKKLDGIIVISEYLSSYYNKHLPVIKLPPLVDKSEKKWTLYLGDKLNTKIKLVYAGSPGQNKDKLNFIIEVLSAIEADREYEFHIMGLTLEDYLLGNPNHKVLIMKLNDKVNFHGRVSHLESLEHVKNADYSIFIRENNRMNRAGFPTKFVESISCGTPVITTDTSDLNEYMFKNKMGYLLDSTDNNSIKNSLRITLGNVLNSEKIDSVPSQTFDYTNFIKDTQEFMRKI